MLARMGSDRNSHSLLVGTQTDTVTLGDSLAVFYKTKYTLTINPAIAFLGIYPKNLKTYVHTKTCTQLFIAASFIMTQTWKQPGRPSVGK